MFIFQLVLGKVVISKYWLLLISLIFRLKFASVEDTEKCLGCGRVLGFSLPVLVYLLKCITSVSEVNCSTYSQTNLKKNKNPAQRCVHSFFVRIFKLTLQLLNVTREMKLII